MTVLVPPEFSIPAPLAASTAATGLNHGSAPAVWHRVGTWGEGTGSVSLGTVPERGAVGRE